MTALANRKPPRPDRMAGSREYARMLKSLLRRIGVRAMAAELDPDLDALVQLREIQETLDEQMIRVVRHLRSQAGGAHSWAEIGEALGMTRAGAFKRFGGDDADARRPGGQPGHLR